MSRESARVPSPRSAPDRRPLSTLRLCASQQPIPGPLLRDKNHPASLQSAPEFLPNPAAEKSLPAGNSFRPAEKSAATPKTRSNADPARHAPQPSSRRIPRAPAESPEPSPASASAYPISFPHKPSLQPTPVPQSIYIQSRWPPRSHCPAHPETYPASPPPEPSPGNRENASAHRSCAPA